nr:MAG TPA: hypothetical protein [Caudoviricetes sp.]
MTVKELRAKLSTVPEDAQVEMLMCQNDNPVEEACRVDKIISGRRKMERLRWYCTRRSQIYFV